MKAINPHAPGYAYEPERSLRRDIRQGLILCSALVFGIGGLAALLPMTGAVIGQGKISVATDVKEIGHPTGGIVADILVRDGDRVRQGQPLIRLDTRVSRATAGFTGENVDQLLARAARLRAERDGTPSIVFPPELTQRVGDRSVAALLEQERRTFLLRQEARRSQAAQLAQRIDQTRADIIASNTRSKSYADQGALINQELAATRQLYEKRFTTLDRLNSLERSASGLISDARAARQEAVAGDARIRELRFQAESIEVDARSGAATELMDVIARISDLRRQKVAADDNFDRAVIRAPQSGIIDKLAFKTVGGIVPAGQTILELVPDKDRMIVEVTISPVDIDQVHSGQKAVVRFSAFASRTTPELTGQVTHVSADRTDDQTTQSAFYRVRVEFNKVELARLHSLRLRPGMPAETFIQTDRRTMLGYILKPFADQLARAFREG